MKHLHLPTIIIIATFITSCNSSTEKASVQKDSVMAVKEDSIKLQLITTAVKAPVEMNFSPDNSKRLFFTDLGGKIWILKNDSLIAKPFLDISKRLEQKDTSLEKRCLFGMAFHPKFSENGKFYVCYNAPTSIKTNVAKLVVSEFTANKNDADKADVNSEHRIFELEGKGVENLGCEIAFGPDGYLYISIGDHGDSAYKYVAQDMSQLPGKLLRIDVNKTPYGIPADNPFVGIKDKRPEIWAAGFRRLWRFSFEKRTQQLFGCDVGEEKEEEINIIEKAGNYGWPLKEGDSIYNNKMQVSNVSYIAPINTYTHKEGACVIGGNFYYGNGIPSLKDKYVFADFTGSLFTLLHNEQNIWVRQSIKILNKPQDPFLISSCDIGYDLEPYVMGFLNTKDGFKGVVYKIVKG